MWGGSTLRRPEYDTLLSDDFVNSRRGGEKDDYDQGNCCTA